VLLLLLGFGFFFKNNIVPIIKESLNEQLDVPVKVENISFSGLKTFPRLGVELSAIEMEESHQFYNQPAISADKIYLLLDLVKLVRGTYQISRVEVEGAQLMLADLEGYNNYTFFKSDSTSSEGVSFVIDKLILRNTQVVYNYQPSAFMVKCYTPTATLQVKNSDNITALKIDGLLNNTSIEQSSEVYMSKRNVKLKTLLMVDTEKELVSFRNASLGIEDVALKTEGQILYSDKEKLHIQFSSTEGKTQDLISLLPDSFKESLSAVSITGTSLLSGVLTGSYSSVNQLAFKLNYRLLETAIKLRDEPLGVSNLVASGAVLIPNLGNLRNASFKASIGQAETENNHFTGNLLVRDFDNPKIDWKGKLDLDAPFIFNTSENPSFKCSKGRIMYNGGIILNQVGHSAKALQNDLILNGELTLEDIAGELIEQNVKVSSLNGRCTANPRAIEIDNLDIRLEPNTSIGLQGKIIDYISLISDNSKAKLVGYLNVTNLNINDFISSDTTQNSGNPIEELSPIAFELNTTINGFQYNDFNAEEFKGKLTSDRKTILTENAQIKALQGVTKADLAIKPWGNNVLLDIVSKVEGVDITELFKQFNNFEQDEITYQHLSGTLNGNITAKVLMDQEYNPVLEKLYVKSDVEIINGALVNYKPLQELSKFVDIEDLMNVQFKQLNNTIEIFDGTIFIPKMQIQNSALNLELEGTHTFENEMKYQIGLSVGELLAKKANWIAKRRERRIEDNPNGGMTAYIIMEGTPDDLRIRYDRATVKETAKKELKKERENFIKALKGEETFEKKKDYDDVWDE
jgi:hypothetical protein